MFDYNFDVSPRDGSFEGIDHILDAAIDFKGHHMFREDMGLVALISKAHQLALQRWNSHTNVDRKGTDIAHRTGVDRWTQPVDGPQGLDPLGVSPPLPKAQDVFPGGPTTTVNVLVRARVDLKSTQWECSTKVLPMLRFTAQDLLQERLPVDRAMMFLPFPVPVRARERIRPTLRSIPRRIYISP